MAASVNRQRFLDSLAMGASAACLVHCLALPVLIVLVPALAAYLALPETFHEIALALALPTSVLAIGAGYRRHGNRIPALIVVPGLAMLAIGAFAVSAEWQETGLTAAGATFVACGHVLNWRALPHADHVHADARNAE